jgi:hypothetical protein
MKTFFVTLVVFLLALIIGCQENLFNEPADNLQKVKTSLAIKSSMKLDYEFRDPLYGISRLTGQVSFTHQVINQTMNPSGLKQVALDIEIDAELDDLLGMMHLEWRIQDRSYDVLYVSEEGIALVEKCYWITNRTDVVILIQYLVTTDGVGISEVMLAPLEN